MNRRSFLKAFGLAGAALATGSVGALASQFVKKTEFKPKQKQDGDLDWDYITKYFDHGLNSCLNVHGIQVFKTEAMIEPERFGRMIRGLSKMGGRRSTKYFAFIVPEDVLTDLSLRRSTINDVAKQIMMAHYR